MGMLSGFKSSLKKPIFYVTLVSCLLALAGLILYEMNGKTQYNSNKLADVVIWGLVAAMALFILAIIFRHRLFHYGAALAMLYAFLEYVINEINFWTNWIIATDPVAPAVLQQYFLITGIMLVATIGGFIAAHMARKAYYRSSKEAK